MYQLDDDDNSDDDGDDNDDDDDLSNGGAVQGEAALNQLWSVNADNIVVIIMRMRIMLMRSTMIMGILGMMFSVLMIIEPSQMCQFRAFSFKNYNTLNFN